MEHIREYLLSVTAAALVCGIVRSLTAGKGSIAGIIRLICGIFLSLTVIMPVMDIDLRRMDFPAAGIMQEAGEAVSEGEDYAKRAMARLIKEQSEAYILDKARSYGLDISVEITVGNEDTPVPVASRIKGRISPYAKGQLAKILEYDLGIPEEDQKWIQ